MLRLGYVLLLCCCVMPTAWGLISLLSAALGYLPALNMASFNLEAFAALFATPTLGQSVALSLGSTLVSSCLAVVGCFAILQRSWSSPVWLRVQRLLAPLLSLPHVAFAVGFAFLFSSTGMVARLVSQSSLLLLSQDGSPLVVQDPYAVGLTLMLACKEVPFLLFVSLSVLGQLPVAELQRVGQSLGYASSECWWKIILPLWLPKMRLAVYALVGYGISVVDVAMVIGPAQPATLAVEVWQWFVEPRLSLYPKAAAGAVLMLSLAILCMLCLRLLEWLVFDRWRSWQISRTPLPCLPGRLLFALVASLSLAVLPIMLLWSFAQRWSFPSLWPTRFTASFWQTESLRLQATIIDSLVLAVISASLALLLAIIAKEYALKHRLALAPLWLLLPLFIPQLSLLLGIQVGLLQLKVGSYYAWVLWSHVFFAFPYVLLALDGAWQSYDPRLTQTGLSLGKSPLAVWFAIKLPLVLPAVVSAWVIGLSVSLAQYLPTLMLGAGRVVTLTTEAVTLASGYDRRITAIYALWQALLPLCFFWLAIGIKHDPYFKKSAHLPSAAAPCSQCQP